MTYASTIQIVSERLFGAKAFDRLSEKLGAASDISVAAPISARPLLLSAIFAHAPRSMLVLTSGELAADLMAQELRLWLGIEAVKRLPLYGHRPWREQAVNQEHATQVGARAEALASLLSGQPTLVVASIESMLRRLQPPLMMPKALTIKPKSALPDGMTYEDAKLRLVALGYERHDHADAAGRFSLKGDTLDVWPAGATHPVRCELFGDDVEALRRLVPGTGQSIGNLEEVTLHQAQAVAIDEAAATRAVKLLYGLSPERLRELPVGYVGHIEALQSRSHFPEMELYLPYLHAHPAIALDYLGADALLIAIEPRSLFDAAAQYYDQQSQSIAGASLTPVRAQALASALFAKPSELDFGRRQLMNVLSMVSGSGGLDLRLEVKHPAINSSEQRLAEAARSFLKNDYLTLVGTPSPAARRTVELALSDGHVSFASIPPVSIGNGLPDPGATSDTSAASLQPLLRQVALISDQDVPMAMSIPAAKLALLGLSDNSASAVARRTRAGQRQARQASAGDPTELTFPFKPGDFVVHEVHGIALLKAIVRQEVAGVERDYLQLEYAQGDKLFTPVEQINRVSRYVGPNSSAPRLTRLNTADWSRATTRARAAARQLAFDLVDLYARRITVRGYPYPADGVMQYQMESAFPYEETPDQLAAIADVKADMESPRPMDRLICGDVGFGKTEVALRAAFKAIQAGKQVMLLAPTTILAQQHYATCLERFDPFAVNVEVLSRFRSAAEQREILLRLSEGRLDMLVGTHRLLSADVNPLDLGLVVIDEEQRFGVQHKEQLKNLREQVDVLSLSATPIPRTLQMALSGVRDMSLINTPPVSRTPVKVQVGEWDEDLVSAAIRHEVGRGGQVYYVSNRVRTIGDAEARVFAAAPEASVGVAHGQMGSRQLEDVMERFAAGEFNVLVATTIIESGLDNPRTNTLIIEDSQRLGLAQLYQLKGRVGRSHTQAHAYFLFPAENQLTPEAIERLMAIDEFQDLGSGLKVAMRDLEIRGAGSLLGAEQSGNIAAVGFDFFAAMINEAVRAARAGELSEGRLAGPEPDGADSLGLAANAKSEVRVEMPEPCFLPEGYLPGADQRVACYRRLAAADAIEAIDAIEAKLVEECGPMPDAALGLFNRERCRVLASSLGITQVRHERKGFVLEGIELDDRLATEMKRQGGLYFVKSKRLQFPASASAEGGLYPQLLDLLAGLSRGGPEGGEGEEWLTM
jgi:transcription-repair coupling factor (superfamily II helicase)